MGPDDRKAQAALREIAKAWRPAFTIMFTEMLRLIGGSPRERLLRFLVEQTKQNFESDPAKWSEWVWSLPYHPHARYAEFKGILYSFIDPRMGNFFPPHVAARIRLDQVQWGGVRVNGIPPLVHPKTLPAQAAKYLDKSDRVFGIAINGEARAYPKRILAWHEMALDSLGGLDLTVVYCTLCGTVIPYRSEGHTFGTSGLLYESSKLMFDAKTNSLWSTLQGEPVIGALATSGIALEFQPVVTTTWGEWRRDNPRTTVLSLDTGYQRDYDEGVAYADYFATEALMFPVSRTDSRLRNKDEVLIIRLRGKKPLAFSALYLEKHPKLTYIHEGVSLAILTTPHGANRVYRGGHAGDETARVPAFRAFWFGWYAQFPDTVLVK
jgi:Protein of unknown function (DUF3179)